MNYKVGDTVVCIDAQTIYRPTALVRGAEYLVTFLAPRCVAVEGVHPVRPEGWEARNIRCPICGSAGLGLAHFLPSRFIKLDGLTETQDTHEEVTA